MSEEIQTEEKEQDVFVPFLLSKAQIAEIAFDSSLSLRSLVSVYEGEGHKYLDFGDLSEDDQAEYVDIAHLALRMNAEDEEKFARIVHSKRAMQYLIKGYTFNPKHNDEEKKTYMVAPYDVTPYERRLPLLLFKSTVKQLAQLWDQDNPYLVKN